MEKLFSYGTLSNASVLRELLGREAEMAPAQLIGWKKSMIRIGSTSYPAIVSEVGGKVEGKVFLVSKDELQKLDEYETQAYHRRKIILKDGISVWVYVRA